jgi:hypothetical protein
MDQKPMAVKKRLPPRSPIPKPIFSRILNLAGLPGLPALAGLVDSSDLVASMAAAAVASAAVSMLMTDLLDACQMRRLEGIIVRPLRA